MLNAGVKVTSEFEKNDLKSLTINIFSKLNSRERRDENKIKTRRI